jgi:hypothetical protein
LLGDGTKHEMLETNIGLEFLSELFEKFYRLKGIIHGECTLLGTESPKNFLWETMVKETQF